MTITNNFNIDTEALALALLISQHLGDEFIVRENIVYSSFPDKGDYGYANNNESTTTRQPSVQERADSIRSEATRLVQEELGARGSLEQAGSPSGQRLRASDLGTSQSYGTEVGQHVQTTITEGQDLGVEITEPGQLQGGALYQSPVGPKRIKTESFSVTGRYGSGKRTAAATYS
jgi:hypothetical protein